MSTLSATTNYSGMLYSKVDESTRFLDAVYARGKNGGRTISYATEFVLAGGYDMPSPAQPDISESASLSAPAPETTTRDQETNVVQIFHKSIDVSYMKQSNRDLLSGANLANQENSVPNELDFQIGRRIAGLRMDLNYTLINGVYQYTRGSANVAPRSRGLLAAVKTNDFEVSGALTKNAVNNAVMDAIKNGADPAAFEMWVNPEMLDVITDIYSLLPGAAMPASRTEGGAAYTQILTPYAPINISWDLSIPKDRILFVNMSQMAVAEKPYFDENGVDKGVLFYESLAKTGASERGQIYGELGVDYGAEWLHAVIRMA